MVSRTYGRGRPLNAPAAFIYPCQPIVAKQAPSGPGWAHELKHDGYRLHFGSSPPVVSARLLGLGCHHSPGPFFWPRCRRWEPHV